MNIQGQEFNNGEIVLIKYKTIFGKVIDYVGFFYKTGFRLNKFLFGEFFIDFQKKEGREEEGTVLQYFKIKRVITIRKLE